jgi:hypothetical protein
MLCQPRRYTRTVRADLIGAGDHVDGIVYSKLFLDK